ncbi:hypothetical protein CKAH01_15480 [Colletotrichum kahawae]|uniref:Uncharacterized protein n=1 Tax=Colletotrichum kahawae TaxID=34407 RepID=A0AAD9YGL2_COLKA|nr:hypothetical protein CKAH01_15480 [Colletotrichum kahawae]
MAAAGAARTRTRSTSPPPAARSPFSSLEWVDAVGQQKRERWIPRRRAGSGGGGGKHRRRSPSSAWRGGTGKRVGDGEERMDGGQGPGSRHPKARQGEAEGTYNLQEVRSTDDAGRRGRSGNDDGHVGSPRAGERADVEARAVVPDAFGQCFTSLPPPKWPAIGDGDNDNERQTHRRDGETRL